jgi:hypothetical protein
VFFAVGSVGDRDTFSVVIGLSRHILAESVALFDIATDFEASGGDQRCRLDRDADAYNAGAGDSLHRALGENEYLGRFTGALH